MTRFIASAARERSCWRPVSPSTVAKTSPNFYVSCIKQLGNRVGTEVCRGDVFKQRNQVGRKAVLLGI